MNDTKPARKSLTIQSAIGTLVVVLYQVFGVNHFGLPQLPDEVFGLLAGSGLIITTYGRLRADKKLGKAG